MDKEVDKYSTNILFNISNNYLSARFRFNCKGKKIRSK